MRQRERTHPICSLTDWIARHGGTAYAVAEGRILSASQQTVRNWMTGRPCQHEREVRALMTLMDGAPGRDARAAPRVPTPL